MENLNHFFATLENNFIQMPVWKWAILILFLILFPFIRKSIELIINNFKKQLPGFLNKNNFINYFTPFEIEVPLSWIFTLTAFILFIDLMDVHLQLRKYTVLACEVLLALRIIQLVYLCTDGIGLYLKEKVFASEVENQIQVLPFFIKTLKVIVIVLGVLMTLQNQGFNVVSLLAGLGLGGLAIALAAQETVSNLFGSITILFDKPFKIGDQIKILDIEGSIEEIGFRSTRIRSGNNTLITIPNSLVAKEKIENLSDRSNRKSKQILNITYETPIEKLQNYISTLEHLLKSNEQIVAETVIVKFNNFAAHSLDVMVSFDIKVIELKESLTIQEKLFFEFYKIALEQGIDFAYPTQKVLVQNSSSKI